jgi:hypothetical protein
MSSRPTVYFTQTKRLVAPLRNKVHTTAFNMRERAHNIKKMKDAAGTIKAWVDSELAKMEDIEKKVFIQTFHTNVTDTIQQTQLKYYQHLEEFRTLREELLQLHKQTAKDIGHTTREIIKVLNKSEIWKYEPSTFKLDGDFLYFTLSQVQFANLTIPKIRVRYDLFKGSLRVQGANANPNSPSQVAFERDTKLHIIASLDQWITAVENTIKTMSLTPNASIAQVYPQGTPGIILGVDNLGTESANLLGRTSRGDPVSFYLRVRASTMWEIKERRVARINVLCVEVQVNDDDDDELYRAIMPVDIAPRVIEHFMKNAPTHPAQQKIYQEILQRCRLLETQLPLGADISRYQAMLTLLNIPPDAPQQENVTALTNGD